jgi:adenylate cyclase
MAPLRDTRSKLVGFAMLVALLLLDAAWFGIGARLELAVGDRLLAWHAAGRSPDPDILIVSIDERSIVALSDELGRFPWPRSAYAELAEGLRSHAPTAIAFDITFAEPDLTNPDADAWFVEVVTKDPKVYLAMTRLDPTADPAGLALDEYGAKLGFERTAAAIPGAQAALLLPFADAATTGRIGAINFLADVDGVGRRYHTWLDAHGWRIPSLPARVARDLGARIPDTAAFEVHWRGSAGSHPRVSFVDLLSAVREGRDPGVTGKALIIGTDAQGLGDVRATPLDPLHPGVEVLASALETLKAGDALQRTGPGVASLSALLALLGIAFTSWRGASPARLGAVLLVASPLAVGAGYAAFAVDLRIAWLQPLGWAWAAFAVGALADWLHERRAREHTERVFSRFVDARVVADLVNSPESALERQGEALDITVLFSDIRGFTSFSETRPPGEVVALLNRYFSRQVEVVFRHGGTIDKFIGDAIMAFWGAPVADPQHAAHAVAAALEMAEVAKDFERELAASGAAFGIGVGLHSGPAVVGFIGSENRLDYTAIGDTVNLASRIEGATKGVATVLVSDATRRRCGDRFGFEARGTFKVKGRDAEVDLFEPSLRS